MLASIRLVDPRRVAVAFCAIGAFLHLYAPQAVLPMMAGEYGVGAADASLIITAGTLAVAGILVDPLVNQRVHRAGFRKHVGVRLTKMLPLRLEAELLVDREMCVHVARLDLVGAVIDEQRSLPLGA